MENYHGYRKQRRCASQDIGRALDMSNAEIPADKAIIGTIDMKLEIVVIPVSDVDRAKRF